MHGDDKTGDQTPKESEDSNSAKENQLLVEKDKKNIEDFRLSELIEMNEDVNEVFGEGTFEKYVGNDIVKLLEIKMKKDDFQRESTGKCEEEVDKLKKKTLHRF